MAAEEVPDTGPQTRPFAAFVQEQRRGVLHTELSRELADLVAACQTHEKGGELTLKIKVKPNKDGETVQITDEVKVKRPEADRQPSIFFTDGRGNVSRTNPRQAELPLRPVAGGGRDDHDEARATGTEG